MRGNLKAEQLVCCHMRPCLSSAFRTLGFMLEDGQKLALHVLLNSCFVLSRYDVFTTAIFFINIGSLCATLKPVLIFFLIPALS